MKDDERERARKQISITDEFSELMLLRPDGQDDDRDRVIGAVMQRIRATPEPSEPENLMVAIGVAAKPAVALGIVAAALVFAVTQVGAGNRVNVETTAPSTAQALGLGNGVARWSDQRDRAPQLLEVAVDLSATSR